MQRNKERVYVTDVSQSLGKLPPSAIDLEEAVLSALLIEPASMMNVANILRVEHFYLETNQIIYRTLIELFAAGSKIDLRTVVMHMRKSATLEIVGGATAIAEISSKMSSSSNIEEHARILVEYGMKRSLIELGSIIHHEAYEDTVDVFNVIDKANLHLQDILDHVISSKAEKNIKDIALSVLRQQEARQNGQHSGLDSGYAILDSVLNGWQKTDLVIVAARPGMGKTAFCAQSCVSIAERGIPTAIFSLEMSDMQLFERMAAGEAEIDSEKIKKGQLDTYEFERYMAACGKLSSIPLYIDDTPMMNVVELRARAMRLKAKYGIKLIVIDYLQLIKGINDGNKNMNRDQELGLITRTLKGIAKELDIPVIALAQLSRAVEQRGGLKRPQLSDLRESGSIEQDADVVLFLYRPEYYKITEDSDGISTHGLCEVIIAKHRNGSLDDVKLKFVGKYTKFVPWIYSNVQTITSERQKFAKVHYKNPTEELPKNDEPF